ncbi:alpha/beta hydrolase [Polaromonas sp. SM01]|uniref:alpha/beta fold hydrolase n=1 Tax=Polaromonas sp. SM01 TaxID=3085630 RepID=UPI002980B909|nr:alpha/beta hydrolase [Polaromonas sp. SM01]MDW5444544.1 alpha/beta hydrolase [Polaromonas sp. SM01]
MNFSANIQGIRLEVQRIAGSAALAPLVFLHEGLGSVSLWTQRGQSWPEAVCLATGRAGLVYSRRGYGQSDPVPDVRSAGRLAPDYMHREAWEVLPALLADQGITQPVLLGHSDGASIALLHASRYPVTAAIVMAPHLMVEDIAVQAIAEAKLAFERSGNSAGLRERLARHHADVDGAFWQWNDIWLSEAFRRFEIRPDCRRISAPLLAIQGINDEYGTLAQLDELALAAPQTVQLRLADCGHSPQRDQSSKTLEAVAQFLAPLP